MLIGLILKGLFFALIPLIVVYFSRKNDIFKAFSWATVFYTLDLIIFGSFTRLTDSGLGCPDWPGCYGQSNPFMAMNEIIQAQKLLPDGPVTMVKAWIEMIHRYLAIGVGILIIFIFIFSYVKWKKTSLNKFNPFLPFIILVLVCVQGAFGALTVTLKLQPIIVTIHLALAQILLGLLTYNALKQSNTFILDNTNFFLKILSITALLLVFVQILLGGWVSTNYAALVCNGFPMCQDKIVPDMDFNGGFTLWRELGLNNDGSFISMSSLTAIHWVHRTFAYFVAIFVGFTAFKFLKLTGYFNLSITLILLLVFQFLTGILSVLLDKPLILALMHSAFATFLFLSLVMLNYKVILAVRKKEIDKSLVLNTV
tara:strand:+ start:1882 stop:2988 length:1107 start_codon:yes stop_codon:yes gene_type:complete